MATLVLGGRIGSGAYGHVYHGVWKGRRVAVKKFFVMQDDVHQQEAIHREIAIMWSLRDCRVIQFYDKGYTDGRLHIIMEYAEGGSLRSAINGGRLTEWQTKIHIAQEIARGLAYIHQENVIHRDLKSANVLLTRHMEVKLCDFGLATVKAYSSSVSSSLRGTPRWMAPELHGIKPEYSNKSDVYALGMVMWEIAANCTLPFKDQPNNYNVITCVRGGVREELPRSTPDAYRSWVLRFWAQEPKDRPEASEMDLEEEIPPVSDEPGGNESSLSITKTSLIVGTPPSSSQGTTATNGTAGHRPGSMEALVADAERGEMKAQIELASRYEKGYGVNRDDSEAFRWYLKAAEQGSTEAQNMIGDFYYSGRGTPKDLVAAAHWTWKAAEAGDPKAQTCLGVMYEEGKGVERDDVKALSWYRMSAVQGYATAQFNLAVMYHKGNGVNRDDVEAVLWYQKSADQGNVHAQRNLGTMYEYGRGVTKDIKQALQYYMRAANRGDPQAKERMRALCNIIYNV
ncbi:hypothetical protein BGZ73_001986 [Actinomortierella ambigua]|nr:hypothetical protein BGZ73_001986 [Actinomortierella ambigua]